MEVVASRRRTRVRHGQVTALSGTTGGQTLPGRIHCDTHLRRYERGSTADPLRGSRAAPSGVWRAGRQPSPLLRLLGRQSRRRSRSRPAAGRRKSRRRVWPSVRRSLQHQRSRTLPKKHPGGYRVGPPPARVLSWANLLHTHAFAGSHTPSPAESIGMVGRETR